MPSPKRLELDARGLKCPLPVLRAQKLLRDAPAHSTLELLADDAASWEEVPQFCKQAGYQLSEASKEEGTMRFLILKAL